ncbi:hypothetical protein [Hoeflea prorocentri]|uniref:Uncharacterized protein n=1 Tax=Hoeflea prorocentri TaxID=1922333 RepID=A0A9X3ZHI4_9HYPH|nr:hypothetical protein [Hoeflea prorocentri]MCY6380968.1 hypothetical protein [Hoeflea prorocentri]MDA5398768.1 hypothetical protein [Hoeflea prorocentri]
MCSPLIGGIVSGIGSLMSSRSNASAARAQARMHDRQAAMERQRGAFEGARATDKARRLQGQQVANFAASGVQLAGSPGSVIDDSAAEAALDVQAIRYGAEARASNQQFSAQQNRRKAKSIMSAAPIGFLTPVIQGAAELASKIR